MRMLALAGVALMLVGLCTGCNKLKARDQLNKGVVAYRNAQYPMAVDHFQQAVKLDPTLVNARLFLATAYAQQYVPGAMTPNNIEIGNEAIQAFHSVLQLDPGNVDAISSIAQIHYHMNQYDKAKEYQEKLMSLEPSDPDPYYWVGVIDYYPCLKNQVVLRRKLNLLTLNPKDHDSYPPLPDKARQQLTRQNGPLVDNGIQMLQKAIDLKPDDGNAYDFLNLMYRQKADLEANKSDREADLQKADNLASKALALMKAAPAASTGSS